MKKRIRELVALNHRAREINILLGAIEKTSAKSQAEILHRDEQKNIYILATVSRVNKLTKPHTSVAKSTATRDGGVN